MKKNKKILITYIILNCLNLNILNAESWCEELKNVWVLIGYLIKMAYIVTPLLLIVTGSFTMLKAMVNKDESAIKKAQDLLVKKVIAAVAVFLILPLARSIIGLFADEGWYQCAACAVNPSSNDCRIDNS